MSRLSTKQRRSSRRRRAGYAADRDRRTVAGAIRHILSLPQFAWLGMFVDAPMIEVAAEIYVRPGR